MVDPQAWTTLEAILVTFEATISERKTLEQFYKACCRKPLKCSGRTLPLPLKTLLFHHTHLRPEVKAGLEAFISAQWRLFASEVPPPPTGTEEGATPFAYPTHEVSPVEGHREFRTMPEDWFDRLLNGVRILFFL